MRYTYFLSIVEHRLPGPEPEELCSVLLDVLEEGDWKSVPLDAPEPILTHVAPGLVDHVTGPAPRPGAVSLACPKRCIEPVARAETRG